MNQSGGTTTKNAGEPPREIVGTSIRKCGAHRSPNRHETDKKVKSRVCERHIISKGYCTTPKYLRSIYVHLKRPCLPRRETGKTLDAVIGGITQKNPDPTTARTRQASYSLQTFSERFSSMPSLSPLPRNQWLSLQSGPLIYCCTSPRDNSSQSNMNIDGCGRETEQIHNK